DPTPTRAAIGAGSCTITNTLTSTAFTVSKAYSDSNTTPVTVSLSCTDLAGDGAVTPASALTPATFTVTGATPGTTCSATESPVPAGYSADETACTDVAIGAGSCTITNTLTSTAFTVSKAYSEDRKTPVTDILSCSGLAGDGAVTPASALTPATFTVTGATPGTTCSATESPVPAGYSADETACTDVAISAGSCTITNTLTSTAFTVSKAYS